MLKFSSIRLHFCCLILFSLAACSGEKSCVVYDDTDQPKQFQVQFQEARQSFLLEPLDGCGLTLSPSPEISPLVVRVFAIRQREDSSSPEGMLNLKPDGALQWLMRVVGPRGVSMGRGSLQLGGKDTQYFLLHGKPPGIKKEAREMAIVSQSTETHHIVFVAYYFPDEKEQRLPLALKIFQGIRVSEIP